MAFLTRSLPLTLLFGFAAGAFGAAAHAQAAAPTSPAAGAPVRVAIVGLTHNHIYGWFQNLPQHTSDISLVGVSEPDEALRKKYATRYHLPDNILFPSESAMLAATHPDAVLVYTSIAKHREVIEEAARMHIASMVEKPLAITAADAEAIAEISKKYNIPVLTNYETTWYASNRAAAGILASGKIGDARKFVVHDGHKGPAEIGVSSEFLDWLTDPAQNGAGALYDFGCYGVDLSTWMMHGELPLTVTAVTLHIKPKIYPKVDDDSTIVLTYPHAQAIIQGSWNWPFDRKDLEIYGATGYVDTVKQTGLRIRLPGEDAEHTDTAPPIPPPNDDPLHYLVSVLRSHEMPHGDLNSLDTNVAVVKILDAARESARTGRTVTLAKQ